MKHLRKYKIFENNTEFIDTSKLEKSLIDTNTELHKIIEILKTKYHINGLWYTANGSTHLYEFNYHNDTTALMGIKESIIDVENYDMLALNGDFENYKYKMDFIIKYDIDPFKLIDGDKIIDNLWTDDSIGIVDLIKNLLNISPKETIEWLKEKDINMPEEILKNKKFSHIFDSEELGLL